MEHGDERLEVVSPYQPAGDQPKAIASLAKGVEDGLRYQTLLGVTGSGKTFSMAKTIEAVQKPTLIMEPNKTLAAQVASEMRELFPNNAVVYFVSYYDYYQPEAYVPQTDTYIEKDASINEEVEKLRHQATSSLLSRRDVIVVASVSCIYGIGSPQDYAGLAPNVDKSVPLERDDLVHELIDIQYDRNDYDLQRGMFRVRGDTVDVFPPYAENPLRISFFGDEVELIAEIDGVTGEIVREYDAIPIWPASHYVTARPKINHAIKTIEEELEHRVKELKDNDMILEAQRLSQRTGYDIEMLETMGYCSGIENYSRHMDGRRPGEPPYTLIDYFPSDMLCIIDESHVTVPQIRGMYEGDRSRKVTLVDHGFRLPSALDNRPLRFDEFEQRIPQFIYVSATPGDYEEHVSQNEVEQVIRPTGLLDPEVELRPVRGQIDDLLDEIKARVARKERVLVTTLTKRMAEDLTDHLLDEGIRVNYMHSDTATLDRIDIIRDLRLGRIDVLVGINLLREGLDIPEVSLVAILDADKEGFLRNRRSLIQTMGRAARNAQGKVIMYADSVTDSMREAMDETARRRRIQIAFNEEHGIVPKTIKKSITDVTSFIAEADETLGSKSRVDGKFFTAAGGEGEHQGDAEEEHERTIQSVADELLALPKQEVAQVMGSLQDEMLQASADMDFERAARLRDQIVELQARLEGTSEKDVMDRLKAGARKGSAHATRRHYKRKKH
ncbi:excinuclease ABC subunit UvrB [Parafannyhessea umbonata]|uniref:UvrABC system protein B n=1 Tax=Parafannyhessea umbonata TaxID=604330 RepID=A0A6N7XAL9_9ACTN|nr:excinuclease ABC subunit UvrB [Parafannyhessea umbonata]MCI6681324.1 excinuclease ABC subunit UvrB [Parafannyhessea umbonata]MCI7219475.1 excinuclease ABC subunit UvrB [Parafannyhessea umbonata]MDD6601444.1 excinuclease ABC subunit UvrB [Parafannyhessea umbonata]MDD7199286.1 excinuclease ABC subunit UvrB [Parafannyhessea umbonata]MDY4015177.1 excinuclease ABC subunit UvrB [Parafannyhessea umbonata]